MATATTATTHRREVQLHSHDFEWEELARECRAADQHSDEAVPSAGADGTAEQWSEEDGGELAVEAKAKWDAFHARNKGPPVESFHV